MKFFFIRKENSESSVIALMFWKYLEDEKSMWLHRTFYLLPKGSQRAGSGACASMSCQLRNSPQWNLRMLSLVDHRRQHPQPTPGDWPNWKSSTCRTFVVRRMKSRWWVQQTVLNKHWTDRKSAFGFCTNNSNWCRNPGLCWKVIVDYRLSYFKSCENIHLENSYWQCSGCPF